MLLAILANLAGLVGMTIVPPAAATIIDVSRFSDQGLVSLERQEQSVKVPARKNNTSLGVEISASSAMIIDEKSGAILWQKNPQIVRPIASITKLLSALVLLDQSLDWEKPITIQTSDFTNGGRRYIYSAEEIKTGDLFKAMLVASSNDAAMALVRATGLKTEDFVSLMNAKALSLGMKSSHFAEPTGLSPENQSTVSDVIKLAQVAFSRPIILQTTIQPEFTFQVLNVNRSYTLKNTNKLLTSYLAVKAGKTGYLEEAGYCLVSLIAGPKGQEIYVAVLGSGSENQRFQEVKALAAWAFDNYIW